jgi:hypothetical protein
VRQRLVLAGLVLGSVALIAMHRAEAPIIERARLAVVDAVAPLLDASTCGTRTRGCARRTRG